MFQIIAEELGKIAQVTDRKRALSMAPIYMFASKEESTRWFATALEELLEQLEKQKIFSSQMDGCIQLSLEYGIFSEYEREMIGLCNELGQFKSDLEQWIIYLQMQHQVVQGVICIQIKGKRELAEEQIWWRKFLRQIKKYQGEYLFLFQFSEENRHAMRNRLQKNCFCRSLQIKKPVAEEYVHAFKVTLGEKGFSLNEQGEAVLTALMEQYTDKIDSQILEQWQQEILWKFLVKEDVQKGENILFPVQYLSEKVLNKYIENGTAGLREIGFGGNLE
ncbi:MAG: hypothetical protein J6A75_02630 [Lachnospiraceae bacterium]|nr:hypothetical protein [Lachnospiraceae bacterium]